MIAPLVEKLNLELQGVSPLERIAGNIVLGLELYPKKKALGYVGGGGWWSRRDEVKAGTRLTWDKYCQTEAGITEVSSTHYFQAGEAVKLRMRYASTSEKRDLYWAMCIPPSEMTKDQRKSLVERIVRLGLTKGDTIKYLRKEYRAAQDKIAEVPPSEEPAAEVSPPHDPASDPEYHKLVRVGKVMEEECDRRKTEGVKKLIRAGWLDSDMHDQLCMLAVRALSESKRIG